MTLPIAPLDCPFCAAPCETEIDGDTEDGYAIFITADHLKTCPFAASEQTGSTNGISLEFYTNQEAEEFIANWNRRPQGETKEPAAPARDVVGLVDLFRYAVVRCEELSGRYGSRDREREARANLLAASPNPAPGEAPALTPLTAYDGATMDVPWVIRSLEPLTLPLRPGETGTARIIALWEFVQNLKAKVTEAP